VFRPISRLVAALQSLKAALREVTGALMDLRRAYTEQGPAVDRLAILETSRHQFEAMCEGLLLKAEGKLRAATNAEARERANRKSYEHLIDPLDEIGVEPETDARDAVRGDDVAASEEERVSSLRLDVAPSPKALAQRAKFGVR